MTKKVSNKHFEWCSWKWWKKKNILSDIMPLIFYLWTFSILIKYHFPPKSFRPGFHKCNILSRNVASLLRSNPTDWNFTWQHFALFPVQILRQNVVLGGILGLVLAECLNEIIPNKIDVIKWTVFQKALSLPIKPSIFV